MEMTASRTMCSFEAPRAPGDAVAECQGARVGKTHSARMCEHKTSKKKL